MHNAKRTRPGSRYNADNIAPVIDPKHYPFLKFPKESPVQPGDRVEYMDEDQYIHTGTVLPDGSYMSDNVLYVRVDADDFIDTVAAGNLTKVFDYDVLDVETRVVVQQKTGEIKTLTRRVAESAIDIGNHLIVVKNKLGHGSFGKWLDAEFGWTDRTARNLMSIAMTFKSEIISDLKIGPTVLAMLAAPSTPEEARQDVIQQAQAGQTITVNGVKAVIAQHKGEPPVQPAPQPAIAPATRAAYQQAERVLEPPVRMPPVTYSRIEDDFVDDVPAVDADEPDWLDDALSGKSEPAKPISAPVQFKPEPTPYAHHLSGSAEWYTPKQYVDAAREVMVGIDLDPASCELANQTVRAAMYYDMQADGMNQPWAGSVFLNPPYGLDESGDSIAAQWVARLVDEYESGNIREAVLLVNATTERKWFQPLWQYPICFTDHRINFYNADGEQKQPTQGNAFVYLGKNVHFFANVFAQFGTVVRRLA